MSNYNEYQESISNELISIKDRVRNFIDDANWGEDGRYKEIILRDIIVNKLPGFASCGTGFVIGADNQISTQIDIIIYRNDIPLLFKKNDFVIVPQDAVLGIIEVKTCLRSDKIKETIKKAHNNGQIIHHNIFNGIFSYDNYNNNVSFELNDDIKKLFREYAGNVNHVCFGKDYFLKYWEDGQPNGEQNNKYRLYMINDKAFGYFISNLIEDCYIFTQNKPIPYTLKRVFYPIEGTKEAHTECTLIL